MIRTCKDCDATYVVDAIEQDWCRAQGISLPRRCLSCRAKLRGIEDETPPCHDCGHSFVYSKELALLVQTFGWEAPVTCVAGCATIDGSRGTFAGDRLKLAELWERLQAPPPAEGAAGGPRPTRPEDLFRGLDEAVARAARDKEREAASTPVPPVEPAPAREEDLPKLDDLFKSLGGGRRRSTW